jgi:hypothetical protein
MKAKTKVNYSDTKKGSEFQVVEIFGTRCTLLIEGRKVDFGISEVEIIANTRAEKFEVGRYIQGMFSDFTMRQSDIDKKLKNIRFPLSKTKMNECVNTFLYN